MKADTLTNIVKETFKDATPVRPHFVITYGPPGGGKSVTASNVFRDNNISENNVVKVLVDDIVESLDGYVRDMKQLHKTVSDKTPEFEKEATDIYFRYRHLYADVVSDAILYKAISSRNHIQFETTGFSVDYTTKLIDLAKRNGYHISLVYPFVKIDVLMKRLESREKAELSKKQYARRVSKARVLDTIRKAQRNLTRIAKMVDATYIVDNSPAGMENSYVMFREETKYRGYCNDSKTADICEDGIVVSTLCGPEGSLKELTDDKLFNYIAKRCKIPLRPSTSKR